MTTTEPILDVRDLQVHFRVRRGLVGTQTVRAVDGVSFALAPGETLGLAGESGSGKSTVARTLVRINKPTGGTVRVGGADATRLRGQDLRAYRRRMQMVYQDPYDSLDPRMTVLEAIGEGLAVRGVPRARRRSETESLLARVNLPASLTARYPGQLSGGQRQRVSIARALAVNPEVIVCDEAVAALDVSIRAQVLNLLKDIQADAGVSYLFISHDLSTLRFMADRVAIMYVGRLVEYGTSRQVFSQPQHPYTQALIAAVPDITATARTGRTRLTGEPPNPADPPAGCPFHPRCAAAIDICTTVRPELRRKVGGQLAACHVAPDDPAAPDDPSAPDDLATPAGLTAANGDRTAATGDRTSAPEAAIPGGPTRSIASGSEVSS
jgi:oligopeptide transport system ATP-binding protein